MGVLHVFPFSWWSVENCRLTAVSKTHARFSLRISLKASYITHLLPSSLLLLPVVRELPCGLKWTTFSFVVVLWGCLNRKMLSGRKTDPKLLPVAAIHAMFIFSLCMGENVTRCNIAGGMKSQLHCSFCFISLCWPLLKVCLRYLSFYSIKFLVVVDVWNFYILF